MKITDLKIGNYVDYDGNYVPIYAIRGPFPMEKSRYDQKDTVDVMFDGLLTLSIDEVKPIALTEELLLRFGFEKCKVNWQGTDCYYHHRKIPSDVQFMRDKWI